MLAVVPTATFMNTFDFFSVNVAEGTLQRDLHAGPAPLELIAGGYGLTYALGLVTGGRLGDRFGRRRMRRLGMVAFALASTASSLAPTSGLLVGARLLQGLAAAVMVPQVLAFIRVRFDPAGRRRALSCYGMAIGAGQLAGQVAGGALLTANVAGFGWRPIFLVNVAVALVALAVGAGRLPETRAAEAPPLDLRAAALLTVVVAALVVPMAFGRSLGWPWWTGVCLAAVAPGALWLVRVERRAARRIEPLIDLALFRSRAFSWGLTLNVSLFATITAFFFLFSLYLQDGRHDRPLVAGLLFAPLAIGNFAASSVSGRLTDRFGNAVLTAGSLVQATGLALVVVATLAPAGIGGGALLGAAVLGLGLGQGLLVPTVVGVVIARVRVVASGAATSMLVMTQQLAGSLGLLVVSAAFFACLPHPTTRGSFAGAFRISLLCDLGFTLATFVSSRPLGHASSAVPLPGLVPEGG